MSEHHCADVLNSCIDRYPDDGYTEALTVKTVVQQCNAVLVKLQLQITPMRDELSGQRFFVLVSKVL